MYDVVNEMGTEEARETSVRPKESERVWQGDISKISKELNWSPKFTLSEGLRRTKDWMEENIRLY